MQRQDFPSGETGAARRPARPPPRRDPAAQRPRVT
eukprot:CAMPEP_0168360410 /NCGR_PEP_ID=MMETSP0228-20121227/2148_1 /TAXON_ID=133427 /ORGANISM="Protoceratium reticulatum, Strain CCCM 535 (=CCMP 1889)" /LENGTH=34 /DNA_ID= /DNA_START= /DNA_END= /DNA_ORIENTATION=